MHAPVVLRSDAELLSANAGSSPTSTGVTVEQRQKGGVRVEKFEQALFLASGIAVDGSPMPQRLLARFFLRCSNVRFR
jgi:hypothetical protein